MSDEFDKEEEKRKLREKYAEEQKDREATGRMSELLLQGATMTNKHCDTCGSPIFRYQGQSFCPTCQAEGREDAQKSVESEQQPEQPTAEASEPASFPDEAVESTTTRTPERGSQQPRTAGERANAATPATRESPEPPAQPAESGDLADARVALADTITTLARRAGNADDPRQARDLLAAAKEAAETLDILH